MKALLVADDEKAIVNISEVLKSAGYDVIVYKWLLKALDNVEEIAPHLIIVSTGDYPRHWKTLAQYSTIGFGDYKPQIILYTDENFSDEEREKAEALHVRGTFDSVRVEGLDKLREILKKADDIFSGLLTEEEQSEISVDDLLPNAKKYVEAEIEEIDTEELDAEEAEESPIEEENTEEIEETEESSEEVDEIEETEESPIEEESFDDLVNKFEETNEESSDSETEAGPTIEEIEEAEEEAVADVEAADRLEEIVNDEKAADRLEEITGDEEAADKLARFSENEELSEDDEVMTVEAIMNEPYDESESTTLPGEDELKKLLSENGYAEDEVKEENNFEESENNDTIEESAEEEIAEESDFAESESEEIQETEDGEDNMAEEQSIDEKLAEIMNANKADQKEKAEALKLDTSTSSVSFVFTNPITLAMVSGVARNYNGLVLEFTPDIPGFIMNLSPGTKIDIASMKIDDKIENVLAEVMSNDAKKLALAIKKIS